MIEPKLTPEQSEGLQEVLKQTAALMIKKNGWNRSCLSCIFFDEKTEICGKWATRPPARVIVEACPHWQNEPF